MIPKGELDKYDNMAKLEFTGERVVPGETPYVTYQEHINRYVFASKFVENKIVLDVASGTGYGSYYLIKNGAKKVIGLDISSDAINYAKNTYKKQNLNFMQGNSISLPFHDKSFDVIISFETIEHIKKYDKFLKECRRVLRNGGLFICSTPNKKISSPHTKLPLNPFHAKEFFPEEFYEIINKYFVDTRLYGQKNINLIKKRIIDIGRRTLSIIPKGEIIKRVIKKYISSNDKFSDFNIDQQNGRVELLEDIIDEDYKVSNLTDNKITTPTYIIAIAKKIIDEGTNK